VPSLVQIGRVEQCNDVLIFKQRLEGVVDELTHGIDGIGVANDKVALVHAKRFVGAFQYSDEQPLFAVEVVVEHVFAQPAATSDTVDARAVVALGGEFDGRIPQNALTGVFGVCSDSSHRVSLEVD
jgi:hypothetical protein